MAAIPGQTLLPATPESFPYVILQCPWCSATWEANDRLIVRAVRRWGIATLLLALAIPASFGLVVSGFAVYMASVIRPDVLELLCFVTIATFFLVLTALLAFSVLNAFLVRTVTFDFAQEVVAIQHLPGSRKFLPLDKVTSVVLLMTADARTAGCSLCLEMGDYGTLHWVCMASGYRPAEAYRDALLEPARLMATVLDCPLESDWQRIFPGRILRQGRTQSHSADRA